MADMSILVFLRVVALSHSCGTQHATFDVCMATSRNGSHARKPCTLVVSFHY
jgi:hypothetical protein